MKFSRLFAGVMFASLLVGTVPAQAGFFNDLAEAFGFGDEEQPRQRNTRPAVPAPQPQTKHSKHRDKRSKHRRRHEQVPQPNRINRPAQDEEYYDEQYDDEAVRPAQRPANRQVRMTAQQAKRLKMQRFIRNIAFIALGAAIVYGAERNFNIMDQIRNLLGFTQAAKDVRDQGKRVFNTVNDLFTADLTKDTNVPNNTNANELYN